jgi:hypothetical protein
MSIDSTILNLTRVIPTLDMVVPAADPDAAPGLQNVGFTLAALIALIPAGAAGSQIYPLSNTPPSTFGNNGDYYILGGQLFGPKTAGAWPSTAIEFSGPANSANAAAIQAEVSRATAAEESIDANVTAVSNAIAGVTSTFNNSINQEASIRAAADTANANAIAAETSRAEGAEGALTASISALNANLTDEETSRAAAITAEANTRASADDTNARAIQAETTRAQEVEGNFTASFESVAANLATETTAREAAITSEAATRATADTANANAISAETTRAEGAEAALSNSISGVASALTSEATTRASAITAEANARGQGDSLNAEAISVETARAQAAEATLTNSISTVSANLATEISNREAAIAAESSARQDSGTEITAAISAETTRAEAAETTITSAVSTVAGNLATETTNREAAITAEASTRAVADTTNANSILAEQQRAIFQENLAIGLADQALSITSGTTAFACPLSSLAEISLNYQIPANSNALSVGPVTVATGAIVRIPPNSKWKII